MNFETPALSFFYDLFWLLIGLDYTICGYSTLVYKDINHMPKFIAFRIMRYLWQKMDEKYKGDKEKLRVYWGIKVWALCFLVPGIIASFSALVGIIVDISSFR